MNVADAPRRTRGYPPRVPDAFVHRIRVRYGECDSQGVVFNANWLAYADIVVTELWRERVGGYAEMLESGTDMVVGEATVRFLGVAAFDDEVELALTVTRLGNTALASRIDATVDGRPVAEIAMRHVFVDPHAKTKKEMPADVRRALEPLAAEPAAS
jgi:acyl-CoA thioester hydrolase